MKKMFLILVFYAAQSWGAESHPNTITFTLGTYGGITISGPASPNAEYFEDITQDLAVFRPTKIVMRYRGWKQIVQGHECWTLLTPKQVARFVQSVNDGSIQKRIKKK